MEECAVCLEVMDRDVWLCDECGNKLHLECFRRWRVSCPYCRAPQVASRCKLACLAIVCCGFLKHWAETHTI